MSSSYLKATFVVGAVPGGLLTRLTAHPPDYGAPFVRIQLDCNYQPSSCSGSIANFVG